MIRAASDSRSDEGSRHSYADDRSVAHLQELLGRMPEPSRALITMDSAIRSWFSTGTSCRINPMRSALKRGYLSQSAMPQGRRFTTCTSSKPSFSSLWTKSRSAKAPDTQPAQADGCVMTSGGSEFSSITRSDTQNLPPGFKTRAHSERTRIFRGDRLMTPLEMI